MNLFQKGHFTLASGRRTNWKIECDALTFDDWDALALMALPLLPHFGRVEGVPTGGERFAEALRQYSTDGPLLIAEDVVTTGKSMNDYRAKREDAVGVCFIARGQPPHWVTPLFTYGKLI